MESELEPRVREWIRSGIASGSAADDWAADLDKFWDVPIPAASWVEVALSAVAWIGEELAGSPAIQGGVSLNLGTLAGASFRFLAPHSRSELEAALAPRHPPTLFITPWVYPLGYPMKVYQEPVTQLFKPSTAAPIVAYYQESPEVGVAEDELVRVILVYPLPESAQNERSSQAPSPI